MNPLELTKKTPMTNCRACGYPTCLAFAAAVCKVGESVDKCPELDKTGLELPSAAATGMEELAKQRDLDLITHLKSKISGVDFQQLAPVLGATVELRNSDVLHLEYIGQHVQVQKSGILMDGKVPEYPRDQILLYNYLHSGGGRPLSGNWIGLESLPNTISKVRTLAVYGEEPLAKLFEEKGVELVVAKCLQVGGVNIEDSSASIAMTFPVMPMVPLQVHYWEGAEEEGFDPKVKILFDQHVLDYLDLESLVFAAERLAERLVENMN